MNEPIPISFGDLPVPFRDVVEDISRITGLDTTSAALASLVHYGAWCGQRAGCIDAAERFVAIPANTILVLPPGEGLRERLDSLFGNRFIAMDAEVQQVIREKEIDLRDKGSLGLFDIRSACEKLKTYPSVVRSPDFQVLRNIMRNATDDGVLILEPTGRFLEANMPAKHRQLLAATLSAMRGEASITEPNALGRAPRIRHSRATVICYTDEESLYRVLRHGTEAQQEFVNLSFVFRPTLADASALGVRLEVGYSPWAQADRFFLHVRCGQFGYRPVTFTSTIKLQSFDVRSRSLNELSTAEQSWMSCILDMVYRFYAGLNLTVSNPVSDSPGCADLAIRLAVLAGRNHLALFRGAQIANVIQLPAEADLQRIAAIIEASSEPITRRQILRRLDDQRWASHKASIAVLLMRGIIRELDGPRYEKVQGSQSCYANELPQSLSGL